MKRIWTIGYEGHDPESLVAVLKAAGIQCLIDVRETPVLRGQKGMGKNQLQERLRSEGIAYDLRRELGVPKEIRDRYKQGGDFSVLRTWYEDHLESVGEQVAAVALAAQHERVCLACLESDADACHRSLLARRLAVLGFEAIHL